MREFERKKKVRSILVSPLALGVLAVLSVFLWRSVWNLYQKDRQAREDLAGTDAELARLESQQAGLANAIAEMKTESGLDKEIRDKFQVAKKGEEMVVIVGGTSTVPAAPPPSESFWQKLLRAVGL